MSWVGSGLCSRQCVKQFGTNTQAVAPKLEKYNGTEIAILSGDESPEFLNCSYCAPFQASEELAV